MFSLLGTNLVKIEYYRYCISVLSLLLGQARKLKHHKKAQKACVEAKKAVELAVAGLALLDGTGARPSKSRKKKVLAKAKEATREALAKTQEN